MVEEKGLNARVLKERQELLIQQYSLASKKTCILRD
jgi:hypothetical protein